MPWDGTELWVADLHADGSIKNAEMAAGGYEESIIQPDWSPQGVLHFISDRTGWWNLYRWNQGKSVALAPMDAEIGQPMWRLGRSTYGFVSPNKIICAYTQDGFWHLGSINTITSQFEKIETPYIYILHLHALPGKVVFLGGSPTRATALVLLDLETGEIDEIRTFGESELVSAFLSDPETVEFPTENDRSAYGLYYPPRNPNYAAPGGDRPPLLVMGHSGPTWAAKTDLRMKIQFWTSRGIAVLDVNYGGSTGYGRPYRQRLYGQWGVVDVDDCVNGARYLVERDDVDGDRLAITGGSAGGYTTLCALAFHDTFKAGASHYGISDLEPLTAHSHKFELHYLDNLVGPYPESKSVYKQRSPIHFADQISCPVIFFQGLDDKVVPPQQSEMMVEKLREKGLPVAYIPFEGEGHGFRQAENIARALDAELYFYSRVFGFELAEPVGSVEIENLLS
jgi:dipeptidyl aminopeptidase/acylaminoacyl peptidase